MTRIHVRTGSSRKKLKFGDRKMIGGVEHIRCRKKVKVGPPGNPSYAYDYTGGRQRVEWVPADQVNTATWTRKFLD